MKRIDRIHLPPGAINRKSEYDNFKNVCNKAIADLKKDLVFNYPKKNINKIDKYEFSISHCPNVNTERVAICKFFPKEGKIGPRIIIYRSPVELRCGSNYEMYNLIFNALKQCIIL